MMRTILILIALALSACATPNLDNFATSTRETQQLLASTETLVSNHMKSVENAATDPIARKTLKDGREKVEKAYKNALTSAKILTAYSDAVARVANSGETGKAATKSIIDSLNSLSSNQATGPADPIIGAQTGSLLADLAGAISGAASNAHLYVIMSEAQPQVNAIETKAVSFTKVGAKAITAFHQGAKDIVDPAAYYAHLTFQSYSAQIDTLKIRKHANINTRAKWCLGSPDIYGENVCLCNNKPARQNGAQGGDPIGIGLVGIVVKRKTPPEAGDTIWYTCTYREMDAENSTSGLLLQKLIDHAKTARNAVLEGELSYQNQQQKRDEAKDQIIARFALLASTFEGWNKDHKAAVAHLKKCEKFDGFLNSECKFFRAENLKLGMGILTKVGLSPLKF